MGDRNWLDFIVGIGINLVLWGSKAARFRIWIEFNLFFECQGAPKFNCFRAGNEIELTSALGLKVAGLLCGDRN